MEVTELNSNKRHYNIESDSEEEVFVRKRRKSVQYTICSSSSEFENEVANTESGCNYNTDAWNNCSGNQPQLIFSSPFGVKPNFMSSLGGESPIDFYSMLVDAEIFRMITEQTNIYAQQKLTNVGSILPKSRLHTWIPTNIVEIKQFLGVIGYMGIVRLPSIDDYWSREDFYSNNLIPKIMSRNRFEILLRMVHFSNNEEDIRGNKLHKIQKLIDMLTDNYQKAYDPPEGLCVDETLVPFRGRLSIRQYIKQKHHKYGIKFFKICTGHGYTYDLKVYCPNTFDYSESIATQVVLSLTTKLSHKGHTIYTDNWYTSINLATKLLNANTHLVGTVRPNRRGIPKEVTNKKLKRGEYMALENEQGITVLNWKDKRNVIMLSTKHSDQMTSVTNKRGQTIVKPAMVVDYNKGKGSVDLSDQMAAYCSPLRKTIKWYRKLSFELLLSTSMTNALLLYKEVTKKKIKVVDFKKQVILSLLHSGANVPGAAATSPKNAEHKLEKIVGQSKQNKKYCKNCYKLLSQSSGRRAATNKTPKVITYCTGSENRPHMCISCFNTIHQIKTAI